VRVLRLSAAGDGYPLHRVRAAEDSLAPRVREDAAEERLDVLQRGAREAVVACACDVVDESLAVHGAEVSQPQRSKPPLHMEPPDVPIPLRCGRSLLAIRVLEIVILDELRDGEDALGEASASIHLLQHLLHERHHIPSAAVSIAVWGDLPAHLPSDDASIRRRHVVVEAYVPPRTLAEDVPGLVAIRHRRSR
jgi:hypothetical protein